MRLRTLLFGVGFFTAISFLSWIGILMFVDPDAYGMSGDILFLGTFFSFLSGILTMLLVVSAYRFLGRSAAESSFGTFFRQGCLLASFGVISLLLSRSGMLAWWTGALALAAILLLELTMRETARRTGSTE